MSSASRGSGTRRRMKLRSRDCSRLTTSEIRWSCSSAIGSRLTASFTYGCRRMKGADIVGRSWTDRIPVFPRAKRVTPYVSQRSYRSTVERCELVSGRFPRLACPRQATDIEPYRSEHDTRLRRVIARRCVPINRRYRCDHLAAHYSQRNTFAESAVQIANTTTSAATSPMCADHASPFKIPSRSETA